LVFLVIPRRWVPVAPTACGFGPIFAADLTSFSNRSQAPGSSSISYSSGIALAFAGFFAGAFVMSRTPYALRRIPFARNRSLISYSSTVGKILFASNSLHATFAAIFSNLLAAQTKDKGAGGDIAHAVWHSLRSDDIQRTVLLATVDATLPQGSKQAKSLTWALKAAGQLSAYRNDAVHTPFELVLESGRAGWHLEPNNAAGLPHRVEKLNRVGHSKLFRHVLGDLVQLTIYVDGIFERMFEVEPRPLPRRPALRSIQLVQQNPPKSGSRGRPKAGRPSPPPKPRA
jgi:hypothetical protein